MNWYAILSFIGIIAILICICALIYSYLHYKLKRSGMTTGNNRRTFSMNEFEEIRKVSYDNLEAKACNDR